MTPFALAADARLSDDVDSHMADRDFTVAASHEPDRSGVYVPGRADACPAYVAARAAHAKAFRLAEWAREVAPLGGCTAERRDALCAAARVTGAALLAARDAALAVALPLAA